MIALLEAPTRAEMPPSHECTDRPALDSPWCLKCSALLDQWILTQDVLDALGHKDHTYAT